MTTAQQQLGEVELIRCMFCGDGEFELRTDGQRYHALQTKLADGGEMIVDEMVSFAVTVELIDDHDTTVMEPRRLSVNVSVSLGRSEIPQISLASTDWLTKEGHQKLSTALIAHVNTTWCHSETPILETLEWLRTTAPSLIPSQVDDTPHSIESSVSTTHTFAREWIFLPQLYMKAKRQDMISFARAYSLTGFVCPGKPAVLTVEGPMENIDPYLVDIRTKSWADIPAGHKKMTVVHREVKDCANIDELNACRRFTDMTEVSFDVHGHRSNHNSLEKLEEWLVGLGLGEAFGHLFPELRK
ncbi:uncharacterized protein SPPG_07086 [Spizellomyces punctatus DAOM BR117]|uniref:Uncharacterized protein n=1 Tax=Spizellomyces punctatus (strain DAOM BR117) TaxID=645134 RepID=A0A0L0HAB8_SPIPD|nr:uncharacterized protein SPPG_07086 [Spizellomyces punctatus DAOM BR117]KNC97618.1 hypothetical protein SPPG_07086 [Spizellomyces punctatus DAOM BR117]|eukprot:XP_016605658.1 hypothetical protein SPPG_07086 [Spizellomyces punctatus DAOM BR117]